MAASNSYLLNKSDTLIGQDHNDNDLKTISILMCVEEKFESLLKSEEEKTEFEIFFRDIITWDFVKISKAFLTDFHSDAIKQITLHLLVYFTNSSRDFCKNVIENNFHEFLVSSVIDNVAFNWKDQKISSNCQKIHDGVKKLVMILRNIFCKCPELRLTVCKSNLKYTLRELLDSEDEEIKTWALLCLSYVVDFEADDDLPLLTLQKNQLDYLFQQVLPNILQTTDHLSYENFQVHEIMESLSIVSLNTHTAKELIKQGIISICETYLDKLGFLLSESITNFSRPQRTASLAKSILNQISLIPMTSFLFEFENPTFLHYKHSLSEESEKLEKSPRSSGNCPKTPGQMDESLAELTENG